MTNRRQSRRESVIKKSLVFQEKLAERAKKKEVQSLKKTSSSADKSSAAKDNSNLTSNINIVPNPAVSDSSEQSSDEEVYLETIEEVEQELVDPNKAKMDKTEYNKLIQKVKVAELAVKQSIRRFNSKTVSDLDLNSYHSSLQNIERKLEVFEENVNDILVDLEDDDPRMDDLDARQVELSDEVKKNENEVNSKMKEIKESQPSFLAENENLDLLKKQLQDTNTREEGKVKRNEIIMIKWKV